MIVTTTDDDNHHKSKQQLMMTIIAKSKKHIRGLKEADLLRSTMRRSCRAPPACRPHPTEAKDRAEGGDQAPLSPLATTRPLPSAKLYPNPICASQIQDFPAEPRPIRENLGVPQRDAYDHVDCMCLCRHLCTCSTCLPRSTPQKAKATMQRVGKTLYVPVVLLRRHTLLWRKGAA